MLRLRLLATDFSYPPQVLDMRMALGLCVKALFPDQAPVGNQFLSVIKRVRWLRLK